MAAKQKSRRQAKQKAFTSGLFTCDEKLTDILRARPKGLARECASAYGKSGRIGYPEHGMDADDPALLAYFVEQGDAPLTPSISVPLHYFMAHAGGSRAGWPEHGIDADDPALTFYFEEEDKTSPAPEDKNQNS
jgi:hypothetical protein